MKKFTVKGVNTPFPLDMLRHDECWPGSVADSQKMANSFGFRHGRRVRWELTLISHRKDVPSVERWQSFAVEIVQDGEIESYKERRDRNSKEREKRSRGDEG